MNPQEIDALLRNAKTQAEALVVQAEELLVHAVKTARDAEWSYQEIGQRLGVSRQAAWERFNKKVKEA